MYGYEIYGMRGTFDGWKKIHCYELSSMENIDIWGCGNCSASNGNVWSLGSNPNTWILWPHILELVVWSFKWWVERAASNLPCTLGSGRWTGSEPLSAAPNLPAAPPKAPIQAHHLLPVWPKDVLLHDEDFSECHNSTCFFFIFLRI